MIQSDRYLSDKEKRIIDFPLELNDTSAAESRAGKIADSGAYHGNPLLPHLRQGLSPGRAAAVLFQSLRP